MERFDVSEGARFAEMVSAAQAGTEVEITKNGEIVARLTAAQLTPMQQWLAGIRELHKVLPPELMRGDATAEIRAMRDED